MALSGVLNCRPRSIFFTVENKKDLMELNLGCTEAEITIVPRSCQIRL